MCANMAQLKTILALLLVLTLAFCLFLVAMEKTVSSVSRFPGRPSGRYRVIRQQAPDKPQHALSRSKSFPSFSDILTVHFGPFNTTCPDTRRPPDSDIVWSNMYWQVAGSVFLYSAYYDARITHKGRPYRYVRVVGMVRAPSWPASSSTVIYCQMWFPDRKSPVVVRAFVDDIWVRQWDYSPQVEKYQPVLLHCPVPVKISEQRLIPTQVSITTTQCGQPTTFLPVRTVGYLDTLRNNDTRNFAVCVKGFNFAQDITRRLAEWMELNSLLGASKVFVYIFDAHPNVFRLLRYYESVGLVHITPITLPGDQPNAPGERTQYLREHVWQKRRDELVPYNDCFYRNLYRFKYVVPLDIDEVIVPSAGTWEEMFKTIQAHTSSLSVRNVFFFRTDSTDLHLLRETSRSANFSLPGHSVKSFVATCCALVVFNHYALKSISPDIETTVLLNETMAQLNHYRDGCPRTTWTECMRDFYPFRVTDEKLLRYGPDLIRNVKHVLSKLNKL